VSHSTAPVVLVDRVPSRRRPSRRPPRSAAAASSGAWLVRRPRSCHYWDWVSASPQRQGRGHAPRPRRAAWRMAWFPRRRKARQAWTPPGLRVCNPGGGRLGQLGHVPRQGGPRFCVLAGPGPAARPRRRGGSRASCKRVRPSGSARGGTSSEQSHQAAARFWPATGPAHRLGLRPGVNGPGNNRDRQARQPPPPRAGSWIPSAAATAAGTCAGSRNSRQLGQPRPPSANRPATPPWPPRRPAASSRQPARPGQRHQPVFSASWAAISVMAWGPGRRSWSARPGSHAGFPGAVGHRRPSHKRSP